MQNSGRGAAPPCSCFQSTVWRKDYATTKQSNAKLRRCNCSGSPAPHSVMDITNMLNGKGPAAVAAAAERQLQQHMAQGVSYNPPPQLQQQMPMLPTTYVERSFQNVYMQQQQQQQQQNHQREAGADDSGSSRQNSNGSVKAFACTTCGKGFARRSDLARHERIHSGDRPHVCPEKGCNKPFIQRSALTVHMRVHSGEKPHMCERCGKPFSDSSSLARHRRIHSGKRPYKCPFADCQKTFTRRTTLTRHQNQHSGTVEEAAAATAAALASRNPGQHSRADSEVGSFSDTASMASGMTRTPSPSERNLPLSPLSDVPHMPYLNRQTSNTSYNSNYNSNDYLPPHMRAGLQQPSPRSSPSASSPTLSAYGGKHHRPSLTSHPMLPVLEPPTFHDLRQPSSGNVSPHMSGSSGWQSPAHPSGLPSPGHNDGFGYPDPPYAFPQHMMSNMRRPQSTEPDHYELRPRLPSNAGGWATNMG